MYLNMEFRISSFTSILYQKIKNRDLIEAVEKLVGIKLA